MRETSLVRSKATGIFIGLPGTLGMVSSTAMTWVCTHTSKVRLRGLTLRAESIAEDSKR